MFGMFFLNNHGYIFSSSKRHNYKMKIKKMILITIRYVCSIDDFDIFDDFDNIEEIDQFDHFDDLDELW